MRDMLLKLKQERHCTYNVTLRRVRATIAAVEKQPECVYSACNAHALHNHLWPAPLCNIFPHFLKDGTILEKKVTEHKMLFFYFLYNLCPTHFSFQEEMSEI
jgi:hypothetical protein